MYLNKAPAVLSIVFASLFLIAPATAEDISGKWITRTDVVTVTMIFRVDGTTLTGTVQTRQTDKTDIFDGKVNGDKISFYIMRGPNNNRLKVRFEGIVRGDEIEFIRESNGSEIKMLAKKAQVN